MKVRALCTVLGFSSSTVAQIGATVPVASACDNSLPSVVCINKYGAVLPYHFFRKPDGPKNQLPLSSLDVPKNPSFDLVRNADFLVYDRDRGLDLLGPNPSHEFVFTVSEAVHEAPVYVPAQNKLYISQLAPPPGYLPQLVIDLNASPPTLREYLSDPPVYAPNGGTFHKGLIYWGASGGNNSIGGEEHRVGVQTLDPLTNKTQVLLNNYFGFYFNTVDDLFVHPNGDVWFTDPYYSWFNKLTDTPPQLAPATYRFRPSTGSVQIVEDTLLQPNGIAISPDASTVYISDTGAVSAKLEQNATQQEGATFDPLGKRTVYAFNISEDATYIFNKRPVYIAQDWVPDGLKTACNGYILTGAGKGVDVLDSTGQLLVRIQTNYTVQNFAWTGSELKTLWIMGNDGISKVEWNLQGVDLTQ